MNDMYNMNEKKANPLSEMEKEELRSRFCSMRKEELDYIFSFIPVEYCLRRISEDCFRLKEIEDTILQALKEGGVDR